MIKHSDGPLNEIIGWRLFRVTWLKKVDQLSSTITIFVISRLRPYWKLYFLEAITLLQIASVRARCLQTPIYIIYFQRYVI